MMLVLTPMLMLALMMMRLVLGLDLEVVMRMMRFVSSRWLYLPEGVASRASST